MSVVSYKIPKNHDGTDIADYYPPAELISPNPPYGQKTDINDLADVIKRYTLSSLETDGIQIVEDSLDVSQDGASCTISFNPAKGFEEKAEQFAACHQAVIARDCAYKAVNGTNLMRQTPGAWNPMSGYKVNPSEESLWETFLPLGMPLSRHRSVTLLHYPPYGALKSADYLNNTTLKRWTRLLQHVGIADEAEQKRYWSIVDVNPVAAPGSGESEYPNDYFPIMMSSVFFDNEDGGCDYIRSMLEVMLNPPHNADNPYTLPLLVGGSLLYDPQAPAWFRIRYKDQQHANGEYALPRNDFGEPQVNINQAGFVRINKDSEKLTPYMICNHMVAAGVTGKCCPTQRETTPDIRVYEAQDLVAASFLKQYADNPDTDPEQARKTACLEWFGNEDGNCAPVASSTRPDNLEVICALAQMDLFISYRPDQEPKVVPKYSYEEALERCKQHALDPCAEGCGAKWELSIPNPVTYK
jgi:hypothetical protein